LLLLNAGEERRDGLIICMIEGYGDALSTSVANISAVSLTEPP
jgi:hypothetical protein